MAANDDILDALIRRQIRLVRTGKGLGTRLRNILDGAEKELRGDLARRLDKLARPRVRFGKTTTERLARMERAVRRLNDETFRRVRWVTRSELLQLARDESAAVGAVISGSLPVVTDVRLPPLDVLRKVVLSRPFQGKVLRRWLSDMETDDRRRIMDSVRVGLLRGEPSPRIARRVFGSARARRTDGVRELTRRAAQIVSQTAVAHVTNAAKQALYLANTDIIEEELYVGTLDSRTTPICRSLDGKRFPVGEGPTPPVHVSCRSTRVPVIDGADVGTRPANAATSKLLEGTRGPERRRLVEQLVGPVPAKTTYGEFLGRQNVGFQEEVLGVRKAALFRRGRLPLDRFVNEGGRELTLDELRRSEPTAFRKAGLLSED